VTGDEGAPGTSEAEALEGGGRPADEASRGPLLDPAFLARLDRLRVRAGRHRRLRGDRAGRHRSRRQATSPEVVGHRAYAPGDDPRRIDWPAYARLGELVVRATAAEDEARVHLLLDASASTSFGEPPKIDVARQLLAAVGYLALAGGDAVSVRVAPPPGRPEAAPLRRGRGAAGGLLAFLSGVSAAGPGSLAALVDAFLAGARRPGRVVLASDLLDPEGFADPLDRLLSGGHDLRLLQVLCRDELEPALPLGAALVLLDAETGAEMPLSWDPATRAAHRASRDAFLASVDAWCRRRGVPLLRIVGEDGPIDEPLLRYLDAVG